LVGVSVFGGGLVGVNVCGGGGCGGSVFGGFVGASDFGGAIDFGGKAPPGPFGPFGTPISGFGVLRGLGPMEAPRPPLMDVMLPPVRN
jgi:hypothetical protein